MRRPRHLRPRRLAPRNPLRHREMLNPARLTGRTRYLMRIWTDIGAQFPTSSLVFFLFRASTMPIPGTGSASDDRGGRRRRGGADPLLTSRLGSNSLRDLGGRLRDRLLAVGCAVWLVDANVAVAVLAATTIAMASAARVRRRRRRRREPRRIGRRRARQPRRRPRMRSRACQRSSGVRADFRPSRRGRKRRRR